MSVIFRQARGADAEVLASIGRQTFSQTFGHLYSQANLDAFLETHSIASWSNELSDLAYFVLLGEEEGVPMAYAKLGPPKLPVDVLPGSVELRQFYVLADWHGSGVAARMMELVLAEARARGAPQLGLSVFVENHRAMAFYRRYGFVSAGRYAFMVGDHADEDEIWVKTFGD
jgi:diamine N-acetyltransferase